MAKELAKRAAKPPAKKPARKNGVAPLRDDREDIYLMEPMRISE
jgi:hypothetical protein